MHEEKLKLAFELKGSVLRFMYLMAAETPILAAHLLSSYEETEIELLPAKIASQSARRQ